MHSRGVSSWRCLVADYEGYIRCLAVGSLESKHILPSY